MPTDEVENVGRGIVEHVEEGPRPNLGVFMLLMIKMYQGRSNQPHPNIKLFRKGIDVQRVVCKSRCHNIAFNSSTQLSFFFIKSHTSIELATIVQKNCMAQYWQKGKNFQIIALFGTQTHLATWSKAMPPCPEGVEVVVRWLRQIVVVLSHLEKGR